MPLADKSASQPIEQQAKREINGAKTGSFRLFQQQFLPLFAHMSISLFGNHLILLQRTAPKRVYFSARRRPRTAGRLRCGLDGSESRPILTLLSSSRRSARPRVLGYLSASTGWLRGPGPPGYVQGGQGTCFLGGGRVSAQNVSGSALAIRGVLVDLKGDVFGQSAANVTLTLPVLTGDNLPENLACETSLGIGRLPAGR
jgi:hypothetical protein